ncbi:MAG: matrixin family metalloprotease [Planctomycetota bacterium]|nr:matrixin family metalloprotease [Planctomycetota bacterium]
MNQRTRQPGRTFGHGAGRIGMIAGIVIIGGAATPGAMAQQVPERPFARFAADCGHDREPGWSLMPRDSVLPAFCFAPGTEMTPALLARWRSLAKLPEPGYDDRYYTLNSWAWYAGAGANITYSLVPDGTAHENGYPSTLFATMDSKFGGYRDLWTGYIDSCFQAVSQVCGARFTKVSDNGSAFPSGGAFQTGEIRISATPIDGTNGVLAYAHYPTLGDMTLDTAEHWDRYADSYRFFRNVFTHELGHALGLKHSCPSVGLKLMEPYYSPNYDSLQHDDILGLQALYGDPQEPDNSMAQARVLIASATDNVPIAFYTYEQVANSATACVLPGDSDWMRSSVPGAAPVTFTARPMGKTYDTSTQNGDGSCNSGNTVNSLMQTGLRVEIRDSQGNLLAANQGGPGQSVTVSAQVPGGNYYSVVKPVSTNFAMPQMYTLTRTVGALQAPINNPWFEATLLGEQGYGTPTAGTTVGATKDGDAFFDTFGTQGNADVYYSFNLWDGNGRVRISVTGTPGHVVSVHRFTGPATTGTQIRAATSNIGLGGILDVDLGINETYLIRVAVRSGFAPGPHVVSARYLNAPANEECSAAVDVVPGVYNGSTIYARPQTEKVPASCSTDTFTSPAGVWYRYTAATDGTLTFSTPCGLAAFTDTIITVWNGCPSGGGQMIACSDDRPGCTASGSSVSVQTVPGGQYYARVSHRQNLSGTFPLTVGFARDADTCPTAAPIVQGVTPFTTVSYNTEEGGCAGLSDRWYTYTPVHTGTVTVDTCNGTNYDSYLAAYRQCPSAGGGAIACNDDYCGLSSRISFPVTAGQPVLIQVGGYNSQQGSGNITLVEAPQAGELCSNPISIGDGSGAFSTLGYTTDGPAEPNCSFCCGDLQVHADQWYAYIPAANGSLNVNTCGSGFDTKLAAYTACSALDGQAIACNDDSCGLQSNMSFQVVEGQRYLIRLGGYNGQSGSGTLNVGLTPDPLPCPADFNQDGGVDGSDVDAFFSEWEAGNSTADTNQDGGVDGSDIDFFFAAWEAGGC